MFYLIDKPMNFTSFDIVKICKKKLNEKRIGHTGTLDPLASGLLLIAAGNYTKLIPYFEKDSKVYEFTIGLDGITESADLEKEVIYISKEEQEKFKNILKKENIEKILKEKFTGKITQIPPKYSAVKINGQRAYDLIRNDQEFEMKCRVITIHKIEILSYSYPDLVLKATVSAGTYIRSIAVDLGEIIGSGGYIKTLRRTQIGHLGLDKAISIDDLNPENPLNDHELFPNNLFIELGEEDLKAINNGGFIETKLDLQENKDYFVLQNGLVSNIVKFEDNLIKPVRKI
ncbi:MAG: tRNA pseudouridine(55) synthase TruB [Candidatus Gracilibacteria bacterium]|nr:tRNA pseudouridine(55) synthase TruB [Candidatus Gracilibacteria bacterium]